MRTMSDSIAVAKLSLVAVVAASALLLGPVTSASAVGESGATAVLTQGAAGTSKVVPDVVGKTAYAAKSALAKAGLRHKYRAPAGSFMILSKNWTVTRQSPRAASTVAAGTRVKLTVVKTASLHSDTAPSPAAPVSPALTVAQRQALIAAKGYVSMGSGFSHQGLIDQLSSAYGNGFSVADATTAVDSLAVDYNAQAVLAAKGYLSLGGFSHARSYSS